MDYILGVDLGQTNDYTALVVLERTAIDTGKAQVRRPPSMSFDNRFGAAHGTEVKALSQAVKENHYAARHLERLPTGTPYPAQVSRVKALHDRLKQQEGKAPLLVVDQTGVGRPVVDMLRATSLVPAAVTITGGDAVSEDGLDYRVPKRDLVSAVQVLLQSERLKIAKGLAEAQTLTSELLAFK